MFIILGVMIPMCAMEQELSLLQQKLNKNPVLHDFKVDGPQGVNVCNSSGVQLIIMAMQLRKYDILSDVCKLMDGNIDLERGCVDPLGYAVRKMYDLKAVSILLRDGGLISNYDLIADAQKELSTLNQDREPEEFFEQQEILRLLQKSYEDRFRNKKRRINNAAS